MKFHFHEVFMQKLISDDSKNFYTANVLNISANKNQKQDSKDVHKVDCVWPTEGQLADEGLVVQQLKTQQTEACCRKN
jgi:hypothetical protein